MAEFAAFCNDIAPQTYWETFNTPANHKLLAKHGFPVGPEGLTPELIVDATNASLLPYGRPVRPVGQGAANAAGWQRFTAHTASLGMTNLSTWRVGTTLGEVWPLLSQTDTTKVVAPPPPPPAPAAPAPAEPALEEVQAPAAPTATNTPPVATSTPDLKSETSSSRSDDDASSGGTVSSGSVSGRNGKTDWHDRLSQVIKTAKPFGIGGK
jgi:hypothetical protein